MYALTTRQRTSQGAILSIAAISGTVALVGAGVLAAVSPGAVAACMVATLGAAACAAAVDLRSSRLPDELVVLAGLPTLGVLIHEVFVGHGSAAFGVIALGAAVFAGPLLVLHLVSPDAMGFGDIKLGLALGASLGLIDPRLGLVSLCIGSATTASVGLVTRRAALPFGPGLVLGWAVTVVAFAQITTGTVSWR